MPPATCSRFVQSFIDHPKPLIALVQGPAVGIAVTTLGLCDVVYCSDRATFHTPFSSLGQSPEGCSAAIFPRTMGLSKANEVLLFGKKLTAGQACDRGLVAEVLPDATFVREAWAKVTAYSKLPPLVRCSLCCTAAEMLQSMRYSKQVVRGTYKKMLDETNTNECNRLEERWISEECVNAIMQFFASQKDKKTKAKL